jgi:hypothetical protein
MLNITGSTVSTVAHKELTTVAGASFRDNVNAQINALRYNSANGAAITSTVNAAPTVDISESFVALSNLQIANTAANGSALSISGTFGIHNNLILEGTRNSAVASDGIYYSPISPNTTSLSNSIIVQRNSATDHIVGTFNANLIFRNVTIVAPDDLATAPTRIILTGSSGSPTFQNCSLFAGDSTKAIFGGSGTPTFTTCYSDIVGTSGVTQTIYANEFQNVNDATRDFRLKLGAAQIDTGTTDVTFAATDIVGTSRPQKMAYDVGAWEFKSDLIAAVLIGGGFDSIVYNVRTVGT